MTATTTPTVYAANATVHVQHLLDVAGVGIFHLEHEPYFADWVVSSRPDDNLLDVRYLLHDAEPAPVEDILGDTLLFEEFRDGRTMADRIRQLTADGWEVRLVDVYEHGLTRYTLADPEHRTHDWDTRTSAILAYPSTEHPDEGWLRDVLETVTQYVNGEVFAIVTETLNPETLETVGYDADWGHVGLEDTLREIRSRAGVGGGD